MIGSGWDSGASADGIRPGHMREWVEGSAVAPELAAANLASLAGWEVLEALRGDRLELLKGQASQYATGSVGRILQPLEAVAAAGGWWADGLDPLADWAPMAWGCFKPDRPRLAASNGDGFKAGKPLKYEHPSATPTRAFWLRVPAAVAQRVADRFGLALPPEVAADDGSAGAFWRWWAASPALPLLICEGAKKAAAALSIGLPAVGLPGIDNGAPRPLDPITGKREGRPELLADLAGVPLAQRPVWVAFDYSDKPAGRRAVRRALARLGRLLERAGAEVRVGACPGPHKGLDDALAAGVSWEAIAGQLAPLQAAPVLPAARRADRVAPAGEWLADACPIPAPEAARLVVLAAPMGAGKTEAIAAAVAEPLREGVPVLAASHRRSLGAAMAQRLGLPWGDDAMPGEDGRLQGLGLCWDSACPSSGLRIEPGEWTGADGRGPVFIADEIAQGVEHLLFAHGTAIGERRPAVLETVAELLGSARQVIAADAQISEPVLQLLEALTGSRAEVIASKAQPMAGRILVCPRGLTPAASSKAARSKLSELIADGRPLFCWSTAQQAGSPNAPQNLAEWHHRQQPAARLLVVDSARADAQDQLLAAAAADAEADRLEASGRAAEAAALRAQGVGQWDGIYVSPAIASGLSIGLRGHFAAVVVMSGGHVGPEHVAQAAARVRDPAVPVFAFCPEKAPGDALRVGSGATCPADLLRHLRRLEPQLLADLTAAAGWDPSASNESPWLRCWLELAAMRNRQAAAYAATVAGLLEREGWQVRDDDTTDPVAAETATDELKAIAEQTQALEDAATIAAALPDADELSELLRKRQLSADEQAQMRRHKIATAWGLGPAPPSPELLAADRDGLGRRLRFGWLLGSIDGRQLAAIHDAKRREQLAPNGRAWTPDLARELLGQRLAVADLLGLPAWLERREWFTATDAQLLALQERFSTKERPDGPESLEAEALRRSADARAHESAADLRSALGVSPGQRAITTLRRLLHLAGYQLLAKRSRGPDGNVWRYQVAPLALPAGVNPDALRDAWAEQLRNPSGLGGVPKNPH